MGIQKGLWHDDHELVINGQHGKKAAKAGIGWESMVTQCAENYGLVVRGNVQTDWIGIFKERVKIDHIVYGVPGYENGLGVETKYQNSPGSIHIKIHYLVYNIKQNYKLPCILVWGGAAKEIATATDWARTQVDGFKFLGVFRLDEWFAWLEQRLSG